MIKLEMWCCGRCTWWWSMSIVWAATLESDGEQLNILNMNINNENIMYLYVYLWWRVLWGDWGMFRRYFNDQRWKQKNINFERWKLDFLQQPRAARGEGGGMEYNNWSRCCSYGFAWLDAVHKVNVESWDIKLSRQVFCLILKFFRFHSMLCQMLYWM